MGSTTRAGLDIPVEELVAGGRRADGMDGRNDDWWHAPAEARHL